MDNQEPIKVNKSVVDVMHLNRHERRRIGKINNIKHIPSIKNVAITKLNQEEKHE